MKSKRSTWRKLIGKSCCMLQFRLAQHFIWNNIPKTFQKTFESINYGLCAVWSLTKCKLQPSLHYSFQLVDKNLFWDSPNLFVNNLTPFKK